MECLLNVCMFSGMCHLDPQVILSPTDTEVVVSKLFGLTDKLPDDTVMPAVLGDDCFMLMLCPDGSITPYQADNISTLVVSQYTLCIICDLKVIQISDSSNDSKDKYYYDTVSLHSFLAQLAAPAIQHLHERFQQGDV